MTLEHRGIKKRNTKMLLSGLMNGPRVLLWGLSHLNELFTYSDYGKFDIK